MRHQLLVLLVAALGAAGCGGASSASLVPPSPGPTTAVTSEPTAAATITPIATFTGLTIADLLASDHPLVTADQVLVAVRAALAADPSPWPDIETSAASCETGDARVGSCISLIATLYNHYYASLVQQDFDAALAVYNYAIRQPLGYDQGSGPQPSDSAQVWQQFLDDALRDFTWGAPSSGS